MKQYQHLFFDLDHTLWDFEVNSKSTLTELYEKYKLSQRLKGSVQDFLKLYLQINDQKWELYRMGKIDKKTLRRERFLETFSNLGLEDESLSKDFEVDYIATCPHKTALLPGTMDLLNYLQKSYYLHIITNGFSEVQDIKLTKSGLKPFFQHIISSEDVGVNKPAASIFVESLNRAGAHRKESLMIGDNLVADIIGAKNCGIDQVFFNPNRTLHNEKVSYEIAELKELKEILK